MTACIRAAARQALSTATPTWGVLTRRRATAATRLEKSWTDYRERRLLTCLALRTRPVTHGPDDTRSPWLSSTHTGRPTSRTATPWDRILRTVQADADAASRIAQSMASVEPPPLAPTNTPSEHARSRRE
jgi:hypothetical protein